MCGKKPRQSRDTVQALPAIASWLVLVLVGSGAPQPTSASALVMTMASFILVSLSRCV
jgi:hypothetical protein